ncbi:unnamed protein product [Mytilus coruscus]|uniref:VWFA domain-containing protein n=1 Tax=Mytilus coruscus TaxID=42192 RepID=A0A6J8CVW8_MYTCO|nr:unnamed protein product [Mytilus coruscus]
MKTSIYIFMVIIHLANGFYPRLPPHWKTKTHFDITNTGILQAVSEYIYETKNTSAASSGSALNAFFGTDYNGMARLFETVRQVRIAVADTQKNKRNVGYVHCNADQIKLEHSSIISCRSKLLERKQDLNELRRQLGECLYTIQSFYSNTNWVEMYGPMPYLDFGIKGKELMQIVSPEEDTCIDVHNIDKDCKDNMLVKNKLTSGYHHGRGNVKPPRSRGSKTGKCSHGGPDDTSRRLPAKCGINKDTTIERLSPHYHLHNDAYYAAVAATKHFLIDTDTGILQHLGNETFDCLFHIKQRRKVSLSFAVDYSGSMGLEIAAVKEKIIQVVTSTLGSENEPANYVLSLFNDPASLNKANVFSSGTDMIQAISNVRVDGGGDCPELAAAGILNAIELSLVDSTIIVFTDADAKDADRILEIQSAAKSKQIKVTTLQTAKCGRRKRNSDSDYRYQRDTTFFESVAATTGGKVYQTNKGDIGNILDEVIEIDFPTSEVILEYFTWSSEENHTRAVFVDKSIQILKIVIKGASSRDEIDFAYPNGTKETFSTPTASRKFTDKKDLIMSVQKLAPGKYYLLRTKKAYEVNITAQSSIEVDGKIVEENEIGSSISVEGSPIVGYKYTYILTIVNFGNGTCTELSIVDTNGNVLMSYEPSRTFSDIDILCSADIVVPNTITKTERPTCEVMSVIGKCEISSLNTANCSKYNWYAENYLYFRETQIESISSSGGSAVDLEYQDLTNITEGPLRINISGVCCTPFVTIDATDVDGFLSQCILDLSGGLEVESVDPVEDGISIPSTPTNFNKSFAVIGAVSGCVIFLCIVILAGVITNTYLDRKDKTKEDYTKSRNGAQNRPMRKVQNIPSSFHDRLVKFKVNENDSYLQCY